MKINNDKLYKIIIYILSLSVIAVAIYFGLLFNKKNQEQLNHDKIAKIINEEIIFSPETIDKEMEMLTQMLNWKNVSDFDKGWIYERLSIIYQNKGETALYYDCIGKALYYLEKDGNFDYAANIYADLANYYLLHSENGLAQQILDDLYSHVDIETLSSGQVISYIYRLQGILDTNAGNYEKAYAEIQKAEEFIYKDGDSASYVPAYEAITDIVLANYYYNVGEYDACYSIINEYENSDFFTMDVFKDIFTRDFIIPYYRTAVNITTYSNDDERAKKFFRAFINTCEESGYYSIALEQLTYMQTNLASQLEDYTEKIELEINNCCKIITKELYHEHSRLIGSQISLASQKEAELNRAEAVAHRKTVRYILLTIGIIVLLAVLFMVVYQSNIDALTGVNNRRAFNRQLAHRKYSGKPYSIIMIDIDNFKHVNDTYGHAKGDEVLARLGSILKSIKCSSYIPFRYGGEEFAVFSTSDNLNEVVNKAEHIRRTMESQVWEGIDDSITISLGVASQYEKKNDVTQYADENLYYSKQHGKNVVTYSQDGVPTKYT